MGRLKKPIFSGAKLVLNTKIIPWVKSIDLEGRIVWKR